MKKNSLFTDHFKHILNNLKRTGILEILMMRYSSSSKCKIPSTKISALGFEKLTFLFIILIIGMILSLMAILFELKFKSNQKNDSQEEVESSSKEIEKLEEITRRLLEGPLQEKTEKCLKRLLDEYTWENISYSARQVPYLVKSSELDGQSFTDSLADDFILD